MEIQEKLNSWTVDWISSVWRDWYSFHPHASCKNYKKIRSIDFKVCP